MGEEIVSQGFVDLVYRYGVVPLLMVAVVILWRENKQNRNDIAKLNEDQKQDIKTHASDVAGLQQNTAETISNFTQSLTTLNNNITNLIKRE